MLLNSMMKRGELSLAHMGFNLDRDSPGFRTKKVYIALKYQELLK